HYAKADLSRRIRHLFDLLDLIRVHVDDVIEHARRRADRPLELLPVDIPAARGIASHMPREINRPQVAGLVRQERLFTAWVRRLHVRDVRSWLAAVVLINEEQAGLPVLPGLVRDFV